jgi:hypothetical protein
MRVKMDVIELNQVLTSFAAGLAVILLVLAN